MSTQNVALRFKDLRKPSGGTNKDVIEKVTGYSLHEDGDDWVVYDNDPKYLAGPDNVLITDEKFLRIKPKNYEQIAENYISGYLNNLFETRYAKKNIDRVPVPANLGFMTDIFKNKYEFFLANLNEDELKNQLINNILPFMDDVMEAKYCCPVKVEPALQQSVISLNKIMLLTDKFDMDEAERLIFFRESLDSILPTPLDVLTYLESFLVFNPFAIGLPLNRVGSSLYFFQEGIWHFPQDYNRGIFDLFLTKIEPITDMEKADFLGVKDISHYAKRKYFYLAIKAVNQMMCYFNDPKNFTDANGQFNPQKALVSHSTLNLAFADLILMNMANSRYAWSRLAFSYMDKVANLVKGLKGVGNEVEIFKVLCSYEFKSTIKRIIRHHMEGEYKQLSQLMLRSIDRAYDEIMQCFRGIFKNFEEAELPEILRTLRNTNHGSFLDRNKFEQNFFRASPYVPYEFKHLPFFIAWSMAANMDEFLRAF